MSPETIQVSKSDSILHVTLNRPAALNAITGQMAEDLNKMAEDANADDEVRVVVLAGAGRAFCAGGDVSLLEGFSGLTAEEILERVYDAQVKLGRIAFIDKPVIASVHGYALGAGLSLAMLCDVRVVTETAVMGMEFVKMAIVPEVGARVLLPRLVGRGKAMELAVTGDRIDGREAERLGLANLAVAEQELAPTVLRLASRMAAVAPIASRLTKQSFSHDLRQVLLDSFRYEAEANAVCYLSEDFAEAAKAFQEKRKPVFSGK